MPQKQSNYVAFAGHALIAAGSLPEVARALRTSLDSGETAAMAVFNASTSVHVDLDLRGAPEEVAEKAAGLAAGWMRPRPGSPLHQGPARAARSWALWAGRSHSFPVTGPGSAPNRAGLL